MSKDGYAFVMTTVEQITGAVKRLPKKDLARFWRCYRGLPKKIQGLADQNYALLKSNPARRSLHFKKVGRFWSPESDCTIALWRLRPEMISCGSGLAPTRITIGWLEACAG